MVRSMCCIARRTTLETPPLAPTRHAWGCSVSDDGLHFRRLPQPDLFPADDGQKDNEWTGGCEDPRLVESDDGTFVVMYTQWNHKAARLGVATSRDLIHWTKYGPVFPNRE